MDATPAKSTQAELALQMLWQHGPSTVRLVNEVPGRQRAVGYTTTLKWLQLMLEKIFVLRQPDRRPHGLRPAFAQAGTQTLLLDRLVEAAFGGSAISLVLRALGTGQTSRAELDQVREVLNQLDSSASHD